MQDPLVVADTVDHSEGQTKVPRTSIQKTCWQRYFSQMNEGSFRASIFSMCSLALGTGCLTIPLQFQQMSVLGGVIALIFSSAAAYWSLNIMILSSLKSNVYDYSKLVINEFGKKWARFLDSIIIIYGIGILISYQVISKHL